MNEAMNQNNTPEPINESEARWSVGATAGWMVALFLASFAVSSFLAELFQRYLHLADTDALVEYMETHGDVESILMMVLSAVLLVFLWLVVRAKQRRPFADYLPMRAVPIKQVLLWFAAALVLAVVLDFVVQLLGLPVSSFGSDIYAKSMNKWWLFGFIVISAPLLEEFIFRGFVLAGFERLPFKDAPSLAIAVAAFTWALLHGQYHAHEMFIIFALGVLLGFARLQTRSLITPLLMHAAINDIFLLQMAGYLSV